MNFKDLHELVRLELMERIQQGTLTGSRIAKEAGFQQAHISNFLNQKRSLSLDGLDRVLASQRLTIDELIPQDIDASIENIPSNSIEAIPIVSNSTLLNQACIIEIINSETIHIETSRLHHTNTKSARKSAMRLRFIAIRANAEEALSMEPLVTPGAVVVLDRQCNSIKSLRTGQRPLYAVRCNGKLLIRFVDLEQGCLILRSYSTDCPVRLLKIDAHQSQADYIVGRVCLISSEC
jgi:transcriptional regulator with XRE-family HTH domain